jgi:ABC-type nitrate/sulfonate/bicarbonate transport system substrate-binding protein
MKPHIPRALRYTLVSIQELLISAGPVALLAGGLLVLAYLWLDPTPPKRVTLATGPAQSAYDEFGKRYKKALAANGIEVALLPSQGSSDNLRLLREGKADLGFVQGGSNERATTEESGLESLGSLFVEPVWLFYRADSARKVTATATLTSLTQLQGLRLNVGTAGSGVPSLMDKLFDANNIDKSRIVISQLEQTPATVAFLGKELDAIVFASAPESLMVQMLLQTPGVKLMDFAQSEAYSRRFPFLTPVVLPRGVVDLARDLPPADLRLVATTTALLTRKQTHPALLQLFAQAARDIHGSAGWFNRAGAFPNIEHSEYPVSREAERAIQGGQPFLQRYLPFWLATLADRLIILVLPAVGILIPALRFAPSLYAWRVRRRIVSWYRELKRVEARIGPKPKDGEVAAARHEIDRIEEAVNRIPVPVGFANQLYDLRQHIDVVRRRLGAIGSAGVAA